MQHLVDGGVVEAGRVVESNVARRCASCCGVVAHAVAFAGAAAAGASASARTHVIAVTSPPAVVSASVPSVRWSRTMPKMTKPRPCERCSRRSRVSSQWQSSPCLMPRSLSLSISSSHLELVRATSLAICIGMKMTINIGQTSLKPTAPRSTFFAKSMKIVPKRIETFLQQTRDQRPASCLDSPSWRPM